MSVLVPLVPGLVALAVVVLLVRGWMLLRSDAVEGLQVGDLVLLRAEQGRAGGVGPISRLADRLVPALRQLIGPRNLRRLQRHVDLAGRPNGANADTVLRNAAVWMILLALPFLIFLLRLQILGLLACLGVVLVMPAARLSRARRLRRERLDRDLPDFLDILSVTVSAGVGFRPALARVSERYGGPLAEEMSLTLQQIANGASRRSAFESMRRRNDSEPLSTFVTAFLQSEELGAPLVETLQQIALVMRRDSAQRARRKAARTVPRVTLVTTLVLMPGALVLIMVGMVLGSGFSLSGLLGSG